MEITRSSTETMPGPAEWFTGAVFIDTVATPSEPSRLAAASVHFTPGRPHRLAHPPERPDAARDRGRRQMPAARRPGRGHPPRRPGLLRARRGSLARGRSGPLHDPPRDAPGRRGGECRRLGRARERRGVSGRDRSRRVDSNPSTGGFRSRSIGPMEILVVEDEAGIADFLARGLEGGGLRRHGRRRWRSPGSGWRSTPDVDLVDPRPDAARARRHRGAGARSGARSRRCR